MMTVNDVFATTRLRQGLKTREEETRLTETKIITEESG
jgi:hypothetical protein